MNFFRRIAAIIAPGLARIVPTDTQRLEWLMAKNNVTREWIDAQMRG